MATFNVTAPDGSTYKVNAPDGATQDDAIQYVQNNIHGTNKASVIGNVAAGALRGAQNIGDTITSIPGISNAVEALTGLNTAQRKALSNEFYNQNADTNSGWFKAGQLGSEVAGTAGAGGVLGKGASLIPQLAKYAPALESGGFNLGNAATNSGLADTAIRAGAGAVGGAAQTALVDPSKFGTGATVGALIPASVGVGGLAGNAINNVANKAAYGFMQSALKPPKGAVLKGTADNAIKSMLENGINVTDGGLSKTGSMIDDLNTEIANAISGSTATIPKANITPYLNDIRANAGLTPSHAQDLSSIQNIEDGFLTMPSAPGADLSVQQAQDIKQAIYKKLKDSYGQLGSADVEANKAIARGLKDNIASAVPDVVPLNAKESGLIDAQKLLANRLAVSGNKDPMGLAALAVSDPRAFAAFMLNRSELIKSMGARAIYNIGNAANGAQGLLPNFTQQYGLLGAPSLLATSP